jgi:hypothetical protein
MIMCSSCKKRPAVVFITSMQGNEKKNEGLCLSCARKRDIPQVADYMNRLGITDEEIDQLSDQMMGMLDGDAFEMGGSGIMPDFISNMFGMNDKSENSESSDSSDKESLAPGNEPDEESGKKSGLGSIFGKRKEKKH